MDRTHKTLAGKRIGIFGKGGSGKSIAKIARDVRVHGNGAEPVTLLDFKAGFEDLARDAVTSLDRGVVVVDPTVAAVQMAAHIQALVREIQAGGLPATEHLSDPILVEAANRLYRQAHVRGVYVVMNRVQDARMEQILRKHLHEHGVEANAVVPADRAIARAWLAGEALKLGRAPALRRRLSHAHDAAGDTGGRRGLTSLRSTLPTGVASRAFGRGDPPERSMPVEHDRPVSQIVPSSYILSH